MEFHHFHGSTTEEYCAFMTQWRQIASQIPLTTAAQKFAQFRGLITGMAQDNWDTDVSKLDVQLLNMDEGFESAMNEFKGAYCPSDAKTQQRRFMQRFLSLSKGMSIRTYYNCI